MSKINENNKRTTFLKGMAIFFVLVLFSTNFNIVLINTSPNTFVEILEIQESNGETEEDKSDTKWEISKFIRSDFGHSEIITGRLFSKSLYLHGFKDVYRGIVLPPPEHTLI